MAAAGFRLRAGRARSGGDRTCHRGGAARVRRASGEQAMTVPPALDAEDARRLEEVPGGRRRGGVPGGHRLRALLRSRRRARQCGACTSSRAGLPRARQRSCSSRSLRLLRVLPDREPTRARRAGSVAAWPRRPCCCQIASIVIRWRAVPREERRRLAWVARPRVDCIAGLIGTVDTPVLQSSANLSGEPDVRRLLDVPAPIRAGADLVLDGGELPGIPSTVVDLRKYERCGELAGRAGGTLTRAALERLLASC